ncbi:formylglycine-generating sulfatase enzyme family protein [Mycobacterium xenopi 4042]|uniref:Formylglycine-generating sulfatase enzyme family protein n=1 Tax=Mycobacterium xenopi 4042 TaxID=1299334 RepID=X7YJB7_MYCXE|nr:formylglycine-generating sulfatase enzyme family protein [Mycobacterium xenopi 4042]
MLTELVELPGGAFRMGSTSFYPEEAPIHTAAVAPFAVERHPVTNVQFAEFVAATGYITVAEQPIDPAQYPGANPDDLVPGALVFRPTPGPVDLQDWRQWWHWVPGACWRHPFGPAATSLTEPITQWYRSPIRTPRPTRGGRGGGCPPRRSGNTRPAAEPPRRMPGGRGEAERAIDGQHMAGQIPVPQRRRLGMDRNVAGRDLSAQRFWVGGHDRQRLGVDRHRIQLTPPAGSASETLLHTVRTR